MFSDYELTDAIEDRKKAITAEINSLSPNYILNANVDDLCGHFEKKYRYQVLFSNWRKSASNRRRSMWM